MTHKITITDIEHVGWARRLIIRYHLNQTCADPNLGGWEYIANSCGYRSVCDDEWIIMVPNTQHPQHNSVIQYAGNYTFVWDYGGVYGLDPSRFDSDHSYIVQLALADHTCGYIDPCANATYLTQFGEEPAGIPGTDGDISNLYNNCGDGYRLRADTAGCLFCEVIPDPPGGGGGNPGNGTGSNDPADPWVFEDPPIIGSGEAEPTVGEANGNTETGDPGIDEGSDTVYNHIAPSLPLDGVDYPDGTVITPGPLGPRSDIENTLGLDLSESLGAPLANMMEGGAFGAGSNIDAAIKGSVLGGRASRIEEVTEMNAYVSRSAREMISPKNAAINRRHSADQLNISPNDINANAADITNNLIVSKTTERGVTTASDAINLVGNSALLLNKNNSQTRITPVHNDSIDQVSIVDSKAIAQKNYPLATELFSNRGAPSLSVNQVKYSAPTPGNRKTNQSLTNAFVNLSAKNSQNFDSNFKLNFITESTVRSGDGLFCEASIIPNVPIRHSLVLKIILTSSTGSRILAESKEVERSGSIMLAKVLPCNIESGYSTVSAVVYDGLSIVAIANRDLTVTDPGSRLGITSSASTAPTISNSSIDALIDYDETLEFSIGAPNYYRDVIVFKYEDTADRIPFAAMVRGSNANIKYGILVTSDRVERFRNVGDLDVDGIQPTGPYNAAVYSIVDSSAFLETITIRVSSIAQASSIATLFLNKNYYLQPQTTVGVKTYNNGSVTFSFYCPFQLEPLCFFEAPGRGIIPDDPTFTYGTTDAAGSVAPTVPCTKHGWIGIALRYPEELPLAARVLYYTREDS